MLLPSRRYEIQPINGFLVTKPTLFHILLQTTNRTCVMVAPALCKSVLFYISSLILFLCFYKGVLRTKFP